jgi:hypothetical protein
LVLGNITNKQKKPVELGEFMREVYLSYTGQKRSHVAARGSFMFKKA